SVIPSNPVHSLCIRKPYWIDVYEVTNGQFKLEQGQATSSANYPGVEIPRTMISWAGANAYCKSRGARLPEEKEWEYAARGPNSLLIPWGDSLLPTRNGPAAVGPNSTEPVNLPQSWAGIHDTSGNVWEWVSDVDENGQHIVRGG